MSKKELTQREVALMGGLALKKKMPDSYYSDISKKGLKVRRKNKRIREKQESSLK